MQPIASRLIRLVGMGAGRTVIDAGLGAGVGALIDAMVVGRTVVFRQ